MHRLQPQGSELTEDGVRYRIWAPACHRIDVEILNPSGEILRLIPLAGGHGDGYFAGIDRSGRAGDRYKFRVDGGSSYPDPASRFQPDGVHGASMVVDPDEFRWSDRAWRRPRFRDLVLYELHVGAFTPEGAYRAAIAKLQHVKDLGANAIEIMPVADFAGERNWGYDGVCLYAPAHAYGTPDDLRALVDAAHRTGLCVVLDVVYNHFGPDGNYLGVYIGDYLDETAKTPWGGAIRYGDPAFRGLRELVVWNPAYWMREFHIDGFRLDATHAIADASPRHLLQELAEIIHDRGGFAIAEDSRNDARLVLPEADGGFGLDGVWADDFHHSVRVANTQEREGYLSGFCGTPEELIDTVQHGWHYRGRRPPDSDTPRGTECRLAPPERFIHCIANHDQVGNRAFGERLSHCVSPAAFRAASALLCLTPYTPLLFMGDEWAASTPFLFFTDHNQELGRLVTQGRREEFKDFKAFQEPDSIGRIPDPQSPTTFQSSWLQWEERSRAEHESVLALYHAFLALRNAEPAFRPKGRDTWRADRLPGGIGALRFTTPGGEWLVVFDLIGGRGGELAAPACLPPSGRSWRIVLSSNEHRFGGNGVPAVDLAQMRANFQEPEVVVMKC